MYKILKMYKKKTNMGSTIENMGYERPYTSTIKGIVKVHENRHHKHGYKLILSF